MGAQTAIDKAERHSSFYRGGLRERVFSHRGRRLASLRSRRRSLGRAASSLTARTEALFGQVLPPVEKCARSHKFGAVISTVALVLIVCTSTVAVGPLRASAVPVRQPSSGDRGPSARAEINSAIAKYGHAHHKSPILHSAPYERPAPVLPSTNGPDRGQSDEESPANLNPRDLRVTRELRDKRTAYSQTFLTSSGAKIMRLYATPHFYKPTGSSSYVPISVALSPQSSKQGSWADTKNSFGTFFGPAGAKGGLEQVAVAHTRISLEPLGARHAAPSSVNGSAEKGSITYHNLWPHVDANYQVQPSSVAESLVLKSPEAPASFAFSLRGASARYDASAGSASLVSRGRTVAQVPAPTVSDQSGPLSGADPRLSVLNGSAGEELVESVSRSWLSHLPEAAFPVVIDPQLALYPSSTGAAFSAYSISDTGDINTSALQIGEDTGGTIWRAVVHWNYEGYLNASPAYQVVSAFTYNTGDGPGSECSCTTPVSAYPVDAAVSVPFNSVEGEPIDTEIDDPNGTDPGFSLDLTSAFQSWFGSSSNPPQSGQGIILTGDETQPGTMKVIGDGPSYFALNLFILQPTPSTSISSPTEGQTIPTTTPTLTAPLVPDPDTSGTVFYDFTISTDSSLSIYNLSEGDVVESGWQEWFAGGQPEYVVPPGALEDGMTYYARVYTSPDSYPGGINDGPIDPLTPGSATEFQVNLRLGAGGPSPTDTVGSLPGGSTQPSAGAPSPETPASSETVNMVNGNLALGVSNHSLSTVSGPLSVNFAYNSLDQGTASYGLTGQYYLDADGLHDFGPNDTLVGQRVDPSIDFDWGGSPLAGIASNQAFLVRWTGYVDVPTTADWEIGVAATGGMQVFLDGNLITPVVSTWSDPQDPASPTYSSAVSLSSGLQQIMVEAWEPAGGPVAQLWMNDVSSSEQDPDIGLADWLSPSPTGLPSGWDVSAGAGSADYIGLRDEGSAVTVYQSDGSSLEFTSTGNPPPGTVETYDPPPGNYDLLTAEQDGYYELATPDDQLYSFSPDGTLASVTTAADASHPANLEYTWSPDSAGAPAQLQVITDPVSGRSVYLVYGGETTCPSGAPAGTTCQCPNNSDAPSGMLCEIDYWDGTQTLLVYNDNAQLSEVINPGGETSEFAYNSAGLIDQILDPLGYDASQAAGATGSTLDEYTTQVSYVSGSTGGYEVSSVQTPTPQPGSPGSDPVVHTYSYYSGYTEMNIAGFDPSSGYAELVKYDSQDRIRYEEDSVGHTTTTVWNNDDQPVVSIDPAGLQTTTVYALNGEVSDTYGPAPSACFSTDSPFLPFPKTKKVAGCKVATVPHTHNSYDDGITGLAATYWSDAYEVGPATANATGTGDPSGSLVASASDFPPSIETLAGPWSARYTGTIDLPKSGNYTFGVDTTENVSVLFNGRPLVSIGDWGKGTDHGIVNATQVASAGMNDIEVDFYGADPQTASNSFSVYWKPKGSKTEVAIPNDVLDPNYGLLTSTTDPDGGVTTTSYSDSADGIGPQFGLATSTTQDPGGLNLTTSTAYEPPGPSSFLQATTTTSPAGDVTSYSYYGGTQAPAADECGVTSSTIEGGALEEKTDPPPAPGQQSLATQYLYDDAGQTVGTRSGPSNDINNISWNCTAYDLRGRVTSQTYAATSSSPARTVTYTYGSDAGTNPLVSEVSDGSSTPIVSTVDLLGRVTAYVDGAGDSGTTTTYDEAGQITSTTGPNGTITNTYNGDSGLLETVAVGSVTEATVGYDEAGRLSTVTYGNGSTLSTGYDTLGDVDSLTFDEPGGTTRLAGDEVTRDAAGRITTEETDTGAKKLVNLNPKGGADYVYDAAGRLVESDGLDGATTYSYGTNSNCTDSSEGESASDQGEDTNITSETTTPYKGGPAVTQGYCYNQADQLVNESSTTGGTTTSDITYDGEGNTTQLGDMSLTWDSSNRNSSISSSGSTINYTRDALDRVLVSSEDGTSTTYAYCGFDDAPCATVESGGQTLQGYVSLPGGVLLTTQSSGNVWSYPNIEGDMIATANNSGSRTAGPVTYDPFGVEESSQLLSNSSGDADFGAFGQSQTLTNNDAATGSTPVVQMGARPYLPTIGRFLSVDPVQGGCANNYVYVFGDPVNEQDLSGQAGCLKNGGTSGRCSVHSGVDWVAGFIPDPYIEPACSVYFSPGAVDNILVAGAVTSAVLSVIAAICAGSVVGNAGCSQITGAMAGAIAVAVGALFGKAGAEGDGVEITIGVNVPAVGLPAPVFQDQFIPPSPCKSS